VDEDSKRSNLGDGLRKALDVFNKYSDPEADKYISSLQVLIKCIHQTASFWRTIWNWPEVNTDAAYIYDETVTGKETNMLEK